MATNFPGSVDDAATVGDNTHPSADEALSSTTGGPAHHALHQNVGLAINAIEDKVGTGASTPAANTVLTGTGSGTSGWATVSTAMIGDTQVTTAKLADDAVTAAKIHDDAVTKVVVTDTTDATAFPALFESATGSLTPHTDAGLTYNASNGTLTATAFDGPLTGNVTGNASGSSGSCTGNAATASVATTVTLTDEGSDTTCFPVFAQTATGNIALETDASALTYNASNGTLSATNLAGTLTTATQDAITSVGTLDDLTVTGVIDANGVVKITDGTVGSPSLTFDADEDTGIFRNTTNQFALVAGGVGGLIVAAGTVNTAGLETTSTSGYNAVYRNNTFGTLYNFSSRAELKENIANVSASDAGAWIDALQPVTFNERWMQEGEEPADNKAWREADSQVGFIADDVFANPTTARFATVKDEDGTLKPVSWRFENVLAAVVAELKSVRARLEALEG